MRIRKFIKTIPTKLYLLLFFALILSFFSNDFGLVDIQKTAIILAVGIDKDEKGYCLTAQISVPKGDRSTGGSASVEINSCGATVPECVTHIYSKTGWVPKFVFCDLIIVGEELAKENAIPVLDYFLRNDYMPDSCCVAVAKGTAKEVISSQSAIEDTSSQAILKLFTGSTEKSGTTIKNTLKNFSISSFGVSKSGYMPFIETMPQSEIGGGNPSASGSPANGDGESTEGASQKVAFTAEKTAIFSEGIMVGLLPPEETFAYNLLHGKVFAGTITVTKEETALSLSVLQNNGKIELSTKGKPSVSLSTQVKVQLFDRKELSSLEDISSDVPTEQDLEQATELVRSYIRSLWDNCRATNCDLFLLKRSLQRSSPKLFDEWQSHLPQDLEVFIDVTVEGIH